MSENLKPLSIKQLIDKLNLIMKGCVGKWLCILHTCWCKDEGNVSAFTSFNVSVLKKLNKSELKKIINKRYWFIFCFSNNVY
jgi:hypothetical protein